MGPRRFNSAATAADGFILQLADPQIAAWTIGAVRRAAAEAGRDPDDLYICVAAPAYVGTNLDHQRDQCRWFGGMVGNHVADLVARYGDAGDAGAGGLDRLHPRPRRATTTRSTADPGRSTPSLFQMR